MDNIFVNPLIAAFAISIITAILGCFVIWRKMAYFGDSLAHSALLGIALGVVIGVSSNISIIAISIIFAILLTYLQSKNILSTDALLGILAHSSLALGLLIISIIENNHHMDHEESHNHLDIHSLLVGDIMNITMQQNIFIYLILAVILLLIYCNWSKLLFITIDKTLAKANNINCFKTQLIFMLMMVLVVASSVKIVGVLLISSLLIIPAACARQIAQNPLQMVIIAIIFSLLSTILGTILAINFHLPAGPAIVTIATLIFIPTILYIP